MQTFHDILSAIGNLFPLPKSTPYIEKVDASSHYNSDPVAALPPTMQQSLNKQFTDYRNKNVSPSPTPTPPISSPTGAVLGDSTAVPSLSPSPMPPQAQNPDLWTQFSDIARQQAQARGYNPDAVIKQKALESNFGRSNFAVQRNNFGGIGAYDSNPNSAFNFKDIQDYLNYYFNMVQKNYPEAYQNRQDPQKYIQGLKDGGYATDPRYVWKVMNTPLNPR